MSAPPNNQQRHPYYSHHHLAPSQQPPPPPPPAPAPTHHQNPPLAPVTLSSLSLESYISLFQALTKGGATVQGVSAIEEAGMRLPDLRAVAASNGVAVAVGGGGVGGSGAPARRDVLLSLRGRELADPLACVGGSGAGAGQQQEEEGSRRRNAPPPPPPLTAADFGALGWVGPGELGQMERALRSMSVVSLPPLPPQPPSRQEEDQGKATAATAAAATTGPATAAPVAAVAAAQVQLDGNAEDDDETMLSDGAAAVAAAANAADGPTSKPTPEAPVPWLPAAMERFARAVASAPAVAAAAAAAATTTPVLGGATQAGGAFGFGFPLGGFGSSTGSNAAAAGTGAGATQLTPLPSSTDPPVVAPGDIVCVCLLEPMDVTAAAPADNSSNSGRRAVLPPGVYSARLVRRLGPACIPVSVCEPLGCPAVHDFYHCRLLPSPLVVQGGGEEGEAEDGAAAAAAAASAALSGRAVTLVLDLHEAHRCTGGLSEMARLDEERLQDAWVPLSQQAALVAASQAAAAGGGGATKRARAADGSIVAAW